MLRASSRRFFYFAASIVTSVDVEKRGRLADLEDKVRAESRASTSTGTRRFRHWRSVQRRRDYFTKGAEKGFDEDDDFDPRPTTGPRSRRCRRSRRRARSSPASSRTSRRRSRPRIEEDPRARPRCGDPARPEADAARARAGCGRGRADPRCDPSAREADGEGHRLEEGRDHEAHPSRRGRADRRRRAERGRHPARTQRRHEEPREGARSRQRPAPGRRQHLGRGPGRPRADERPLPAHRRQDQQGRPRRDRAVGAEGREMAIDIEARGRTLAKRLSTRSKARADLGSCSRTWSRR